MYEYQIFSDSSCDLTSDEAGIYNIKLIPFYISFDRENYYKEATELSLEEYYGLLSRKGLFPTTSTPSVQDYIDAFTPDLALGKDIICFTISDHLSASYQSAQLAKKTLEESYPEAKIAIVNSHLVTGLQRMLVMEASRMQTQGKTFSEVLKAANSIKKTGKIYFMVGTLDYLLKGGRLGKIVSMSGSILNIKPLLYYRNKDLSLMGIVRSRKKGLEKIIHQVISFFAASGENIYDYIFIVGSTNAMEEALSFKKILEKELGFPQFEKTFFIGGTISSHTGPGTIGVGFIKKA